MEQTDAISTLEIKDQEHEDNDGKTGINSSRCKHDSKCSADSDNT